jgi:hypothetical protein
VSSFDTGPHDNHSARLSEAPVAPGFDRVPAGALAAQRGGIGATCCRHVSWRLGGDYTAKPKKKCPQAISSVPLCDVILAVTRLSAGIVASALWFGCATAEATRDADSKQVSSSVSPLTVDDPSSTDDPKVAGEEAALRRAYGASDMKMHPCAASQEDGSIVGKQCPSALVVFGPYVTVPSKSDVKLRFDIESPTSLRVMSDVLSNSAKQFHGAVEEQMIQAREKRTVSYRIHVFDAVRALETRIGIRTDAPVDFTITNLTLSVE